MELKLSKNAAGAMWNALCQHTVKGRSDARKHAKLTMKLREGATRRVPAPADASPEQIAQHEKQDHFEFNEGALALNEKLLDYLDVVLDKRLDDGVPGNIGHGYGELVLALDVVRGKAAAEE